MLQLTVMKTFIIRLFAICVVAHVPSQAQLIVRELQTTTWISITSLQTLSQEGGVLAVANFEAPLVSKDGGMTFTSALSAEDQFLLGGKVMIASDGRGHGIISGSKSTKTQFVTDDGGETWQKREFPSYTPEGSGVFELFADGNTMLSGWVSADAGISWRKYVVPDSVLQGNNGQWSWGHSYGRGSLVRPVGVNRWYCIDHASGLFTERPDIPSEASYACELANGAKIVGIVKQDRPRVMICPPGKECFSIDSIEPSVSLKDYGINRMLHFNDYVVLTFTSSPYVVVLGLEGHRILDVRTIVPDAKSVIAATCNSVGIALRLSGYRVLVPHDGSQPKVVRTVLPVDNFEIPVGNTLVGVNGQALMSTDFADGSVRRVGHIPNLDRRLGERTRFRDVYPEFYRPYACSDERHVIRIDTSHVAPLEWRLGPFGRFDPLLVDEFEIPVRARRRHEAQFGCSNFWLLARDVTASGGPSGLRIEHHVSDTTFRARVDTITMMSSVNNGATIYAGHRGLWSSTDTGITWTSISLPNVGSVVSAYAEVQNKRFVGYRGFDNTLNQTDWNSTAGGLYVSTDGGTWEKVGAVPGNYIYHVSVDAQNWIWVVSTSAQREYTADVSESDTLVTQIDVLQEDIHVHRSTDGGTSWQLVHSESPLSSFSPITGVVSQGQNGHVLAMPTRLLHLAKGSSVFTPIDVLPFGLQLYSTRVDPDGRAWVATSHGVYVVETEVLSSVPWHQNSAQNQIRVSPHPVASGESAKIDCPTCPSLEFNVIDVVGRVVGQVSGGLLLTQTLVPGVYFLRSSNGSTIRVLVK